MSSWPWPDLDLTRIGGCSLFNASAGVGRLTTKKKVRFFEVLHATNSIRSCRPGRSGRAIVLVKLSKSRWPARPVHCDIVLVKLSRNANVCYSIRTCIPLQETKRRRQILTKGVYSFQNLNFGPQLFWPKPTGFFKKWTTCNPKPGYRFILFCRSFSDILANKSQTKPKSSVDASRKGLSQCHLAVQSAQLQVKLCCCFLGYLCDR